MMINIAAFTFAFSIVIAIVITEVKAYKGRAKRGSDSVATPKVTTDSNKPTYLADLLKFDYDDFHSDDFKRLAEDENFDYFEKICTKIGNYVDMILNNEIDEEYEEEILLYLICYIGYHPKSNLYGYKLFDLLTLLRMKYGMILTREDIKYYRICKCWNNNRPTINAYIGNRDCANEDEYMLLYQYYKDNINKSSINNMSKASLTLFLLQSRFAGCYGHARANYVNFDDITLDFVKYAKEEMKRGKHTTLLGKSTRRCESYEWISKGLLYYINMLHKADSISRNRAVASNKYNKLKYKVDFYERILGLCNIPNRPKAEYLTDLQLKVSYYERVLHIT